MKLLRAFFLCLTVLLTVPFVLAAADQTWYQRLWNNPRNFVNHYWKELTAGKQKAISISGFAMLVQKSQEFKDTVGEFPTQNNKIA